MGRKPSKDGVTRTFTLRSDLVEWIDAFSAHTRLSKTAIVELALDEYISQHISSEVNYGSKI